MTYPHIDPVILSLGPLAIRWYGLMYLLGFVGGLFMVRHVARLRNFALDKEGISDLLFYAVVGVIVGGRVGYTLFYNAFYYLHHPLEILYVWEGGMSFHGGLIGVVIALVVYCKRKKLPLLMIGDLVVVAAPIGLALGRLGNFINGELWGRVTDVHWGMVFPGAGPLPRHPSQLYEASLEGVILLIVMYLLHRTKPAMGVPVFVFLLGYGLLRFIVEFFRQPDSQLGFLWGGATMGQLLCVPMIVIGFCGMILLLNKGKE